MDLSHDFPFDPRHGYDLPRLLSVGAPAPPEDFDAFWQASYAAALRVEVAPTTEPLPYVGEDHRLFLVRFTSVGGRRIGAWLTLPADGRVTHGCVVTHGYGGRDAPEPDLLGPGAAAIWPCLRGLGTLSRYADVPEDSADHVLHGIEARETYVHGECAADVWCAATALLELVPDAASRLAYVGGSFGGGIGPLALPWDDRFHAAALEVPSFGNHPLRLTLPCTGSGESVRAYAAKQPAVRDVLAYFDAATAATRVRVPTLVAAALFDPAVPPPGQFAVHNALAGPKELHTLTAGHFAHPAEAAEAAELVAVQRRFLTEHLGLDR